MINPPFLLVLHRFVESSQLLGQCLKHRSMTFPLLYDWAWFPQLDSSQPFWYLWGSLCLGSPVRVPWKEGSLEGGKSFQILTQNIIDQFLNPMPSRYDKKEFCKLILGWCHFCLSMFGSIRFGDYNRNYHLWPCDDFFLGGLLIMVKLNY